MIKGKEMFWIILLILACKITAFSQGNSTDKIDLKTIINAAITNNPGIKDGQIKADISKNEINLTKSALFPRVSTNASYSLSNQNSVGNDYGSVSSGINLNQTLWQNGKNKALIKQSEFLYQAELSEFEAKKQELILQVKFSYFNLLRYRKLYKVSENNLLQAELFLEAAKEKNKLGIGKYSDILKAESELADAKYFSQNYSYSLKAAENELSRLTGLSISANSLSNDQFDLDFISYELFESDSLFALAVKNYPELGMLENIRSSQKFYEKAVKADLYPTVSTNAGYNWYYNPIFKGQDTWNAGISVSWDLFDGNRRKNQVKIEKLRSQSFQFQKEDLLLELKKEIDNKINAFQEAKDQIKISKILMNSTAENLKMLEEEYRQGISSMLELTNARTDDFNAKAKYINALTDYELVLAQIERIIGVINIKN